MSTPRCTKCGGHRSGTCCDCGYHDEAKRHKETCDKLAVLEARLKEIEQIEAVQKERVDSIELRRRGGKWLGAARSWLQHRRTTRGIHGDRITWGDENAVFELSSRAVEEIAAEIAAAAFNEQGDMRTALEQMRKRYFDEQVKREIAEHERDRLRTELEIVTGTDTHKALEKAKAVADESEAAIAQMKSILSRFGK